MNYKFFHNTMGITEFIDKNWYDLPNEIRQCYTNESFAYEQELIVLRERIDWLESDIEYSDERIENLKEDLDSAEEEIRFLKEQLGDKE